MMYQWRDMPCKMVNIGSLESYEAIMTLPTGMNEDMVLMRVLLFQFRMVMVEVPFMSQLRKDLMNLLMMHQE